MIEISKGIASIAATGGKIQIVASPYLSDEDVEAIRLGYEAREKIIENALLRDLDNAPTDYFSTERLNLLANLIADGVLDIRIAYTESHGGIGMYHEKMGIIEDADGNSVAFSGSMNESATAMRVNYETIDVFCSWKDGIEADRVRSKAQAFTSIWNDCEPNIHVLSFPSISQSLIEKYRKKDPRLTIDDEQFTKHIARRAYTTEIDSISPPGARIPSNVTLHEYQEEAIASWVGENYRGIFDMANAVRLALQRSESFDYPIDEALQYAFIGLILAVDKYDPDINGAFASYANLYMVQSISRDQPLRNSVLYYPVHKKEEYYTVYPDLKKRGCPACPDIAECKKVIEMISSKMDCDEERAAGILYSVLPVFSLDERNEVFLKNIRVFEKHGIDVSRVEYYNCFVYSHGDDLDEAVMRQFLETEVDQLLHTLSYREREVLSLRYGLSDGIEHTLSEVGEVFSVTRERIRQIEVRALAKLRHPMYSRKIRKILD